MYRNAELLMPEPPVLPVERTSVPDDVERARAMARDIGADGFALFLTVPGLAGSRLVAMVDTAHPGLAPQSRQVIAASSDEFVRVVLSSGLPATWKGGDTTALPRWVRRIAAPAEISAGIAFPVSCRQRRNGIAIFYGTPSGLDERMLGEVHGFCYALFAEASECRPGGLEPLPVMSKREIECLKLTANGLTSVDIAANLKLSVHTANQHLATSAQKLNAVNRIHAVAKALRIGLID